jgi:hypothetical protein
MKSIAPLNVISRGGIAYALYLTLVMAAGLCAPALVYDAYKSLHAAGEAMNTALTIITPETRLNITDTMLSNEDPDMGCEE